VLAQHVSLNTHSTAGVDWSAALAAYEAVRTEHCRRVLSTSRSWGALWHLDGSPREQRNVILRARAVNDYSFTDWLYEPTALFPEEEPEIYSPIPLDTAARG
jgi:salicylate hydroxylase